MTSEADKDKIRKLIQEVIINEGNFNDESSDSESDFCEQVLENSNTEQSDNSDNETDLSNNN